MTRRKNTINIYDYPEHLNPFREEDDNNDNFNTTGRRRSSFRVNAWNVFSPNKGKSKASEDINPVSETATSRFMTWTPKLLRKASFRRSSPPSRPAQPLGPRESVSSTDTRLSFRSTTSRCTLPPSSSRTSLPPSNSRTSLPPSGSRSTLNSSSSRSTLPHNDSCYTFSSSRPSSPPSRPTSPPSRPAPPNVRTSLSPSRPSSPPPVTPAMIPSTEIALNNVIIGSKQTTPVPSNRKALFPMSPTEKTAGEQPSEDETKYMQQGAKPKKKRRAPAPPTPSPGKSTDSRPVISTESDTSMTSSVTSSSAEEPPQQEHSVTPSSDLEVTAQEPEPGPRNGEVGHHPEIGEREHPNGEQILIVETMVEENHSENGVEEHADQSKNEHNELQELGNIQINGMTESGDQLGNGQYVVRKDDETMKTGKDPGNGIIKYDEDPSPKIEHDIRKIQDDIRKLQETLENELENGRNQSAVGNPSRQEDGEIHNGEHRPENGPTELRKHLEDCAPDTKTDVDITGTCRLHKVNNSSSENVGLQEGEEELNNETTKQTKQLIPEPKPRIL